MADVRGAMILAYIDWYICQPQRVRDHCLDVFEMKKIMRRLKTKENADAVTGD